MLIPNGTRVWFLRKEHSTDHYEAIVESSYPLFQRQGYHYTIKCPAFPFIIGFVHEEELCTDAAQAAASSRLAKIEDLGQKIDSLLSDRSYLDNKILDLSKELDRLKRQTQT
jgi:hypothetical protein